MTKHSRTTQYAEDLADVVADVVGGAIEAGYWVALVALYVALPLAALIWFVKFVWTHV